MPFINTKVSVKITDQQEERLKTELGKAISLIGGKSETWLMLNFEDECKMYFRGDNESPTAFIEVKIFGVASGAEYNRLTSKITEIISDNLNIAPDRVYIAYQEIEYWGYNGHNF